MWPLIAIDGGFEGNGEWIARECVEEEEKVKIWKMVYGFKKGKQFYEN
jgi:hypothetical protein